MKKLNLLLSGLLLVMILSIGIGSAMAYFTDSQSASGEVTVSAEYHATPREDISDNVKYIQLTADKDSRPVYVRARAYSSYTVTYTGEAGWRDGGDGWWYYDDPIEDGEATTTLKAEIKFPEGKDGDTTKVIVVTEYTPVQYDENGTAKPADYSIKVNEGGES